MNNRLKVMLSVGCWACVAAIPLAMGCGQKAPPPASTPAPADSAAAAAAAPAAATSAAPAGGNRRARAKIATTSDGGVSGTVSFAETSGQIEVALDLDKVPPGQHAWHIHEGTSCGREKLADGGLGAPGSAAGPHWNPTKKAHGMPGAKEHHPGDFGNFTAEKSGKASAKLTTDAFNLGDTGELSAMGHAVIIHGGVDDGQGVNGDAGSRIGCGVIEKQ